MVNFASRRAGYLLYVPSARAYRADQEECNPYPGHWERGRSHSDGTIKWQGQQRFIAEPLSGRVARLVETAEDFWELRYQRTLIGVIDGRGGQVKIRDPLRVVRSPA